MKNDRSRPPFCFKKSGLAALFSLLFCFAAQPVFAALDAIFTTANDNLPVRIQSDNFENTNACGQSVVRFITGEVSDFTLLSMYEEPTKMYAIPKSQTTSYKFTISWLIGFGSISAYLGPYSEPSDLNDSYNFLPSTGCTLGWFQCKTLSFKPSIINTNAAQNNAMLLIYKLYDPTLAIVKATIVIPIIITGEGGTVRGTTRGPKLPTLVVHDPPGDQSFATVKQGKSICHGYGMSLAINSSQEIYGTAKLGVKYEVGEFVSTSVEAYGEVSASLKTSVSTTSSSEYEMCYETTSSYSTSENTTGGDIFIGSQMDYYYGFWHKVWMNGCVPARSKQPCFSVAGAVESFTYSEKKLRELVAADEAFFAQLPDSTKIYFSEQINQMKVWKQALANNDALKASADEYPGTGQSFSGGIGPGEFSTTISTSKTTHIDTEMAVDSEYGIEAGLEVAGSGFTGGTKMKSRFGFGSTSSGSNANSNTVSYTLKDDDVDDFFKMKIYKDPVYGTPIFKLDDFDSKTSCPHEGGQKMDNPVMQFAGDPAATVKTFSDFQPGSVASFKVNLCNDGPFTRTYHLKIRNGSNPDGATIKALGKDLAFAEGAEVTLAPFACQNNVTVYVEQPAPSAILFANLELVFYSKCQEIYEPIEKKLVFTVFFGTAAPNDEICNAIHLPVNGGVQTGFSNNLATAVSGEQALAPIVDCANAWCENTMHNTVWFKFTLPANSDGTATVSTCGLADFDTQIALYSLTGGCSSLANFTVLAANDDGPQSCATDYDSELKIGGLAAGETYFVVVDGWEGAKGSFGIRVDGGLKVVASNDEACFATVLTTDGTILPNQNNENATVNPIEATLVAAISSDCLAGWCTEEMPVQINNSVWYSFTAPPSGKVVVSTCGISDFDSQLAVFSANDCSDYGSFTLIAANDDGPVSCATDYDSELPVAGLVAGKTYFVMVDGFQGAFGLFGIKITAEAIPVPGNDGVCNAILLPTNGSVQTGFSNIGSTVSTGEQAIVPTENDCNSSWCENGGNIIEHSVWFKFIAPPSGKVQVSLCDLADFDSQIAVYQFANCADFASLSMLGANDDGPASCATAYDSELELAGLVAGGTYHILVDGWTGATGNFGIKITEITVQTVANDLPCNAIPIPVNGTVQTGFSNLNATVSADESALAPTATDCNTSWCETGGNTIQHSVWFKFVAPASGKVEVSTCGLAEFDSQLAVYKSADCGIFSTFTLLAANDDGPTTCATDFDSQLDLAGLTTGTTYWVMVDGYGAAAGNFGIKITEIPTVGTDDLEDEKAAMHLFPNPASDRITVQLEKAVSASNLLIFNNLGLLVKTVSIEKTTSPTVEIDLAGLAAGSYFLHVETQKGRPLVSRFSKI